MFLDIFRVVRNAFIKTCKELYWNYSAMDRDQACRILNISNRFNQKQLTDSYMTLLHGNPLSRSNSPYLREKIKTAFKVLKNED